MLHLIIISKWQRYAPRLEIHVDLQVEIRSVFGILVNIYDGAFFLKRFTAFSYELFSQKASS